LPAGITLSAGGTLSGTPTTAGTYSFTVQVKDSASQTAQKSLSLTVASGTSSAFPSFNHVLLVIEENTGYSSVVGSSSMPYLNGLIGKYGLATNYTAATHPSIDNYFMLTAGAYFANNNDSWDCSTTTGVISADNMVRELNNAGKTWKDYDESIPSTGYTGCDTGGYAKKHNPFAFFNDVANTAQKNQMVDFTGNFANDVANGTLPNFSLVIPNLCDDAHDCGLSTADSWLQSNIDPFIKSTQFANGGLVVILFDEDSSTGSSGCSGTQENCGGHIACVIVAPNIVSPGFKSSVAHYHSDVLRLILQGLGAKTYPGLGASSSNFSEFFK
jgi:hypothetical protein